MTHFHCTQSASSCPGETATSLLSMTHCETLNKVDNPWARYWARDRGQAAEPGASQMSHTSLIRRMGQWKQKAKRATLPLGDLADSIRTPTHKHTHTHRRKSWAKSFVANKHKLGSWLTRQGQRDAFGSMFQNSKNSRRERERERRHCVFCKRPQELIKYFIVL